jgi:predicted  nucleic acid-binding Zn-ribbon protein
MFGYDKASLNVDTRTGPNADKPKADSNLPATAAAAPADSETSSDPTTQMLKQLQDQLRQIMDQIKRLQASSVPDEQKMPMLQSLNAEAATIQGQIEALMQKQMQAASGSVTA